MKSILTIVALAVLIPFYLSAQQESIEKILNEKGRIKNHSTGSYSAAGYEMTYGKNKEPIFKKSSSLQKTSSTYGWGTVGSGHNGTDNTINAIAVDGSGNMYVGGQFAIAGETPASNIAKWNGIAWSTLGGGVSSSVYAIAISGTGEVYAGGYFQLADGIHTGSGEGSSYTGGITVNNIAKWSSADGWSALGTSTDVGVCGGTSYVNAIAVSGSDVYVGGDFLYAGGTSSDGNTHTSGGTSVSNIAKWNGSNWSALGAGVSGGDNPHVYALAINGGSLYVGGRFTSPGSNIAKWDGAWSTLGVGVSGTVNAIGISGTDLYAGGHFLTAGGITVRNIAKWNGTNWSALGDGVGDWEVKSISIAGSGEVYAGGSFTSAGPGYANNIAKWTPSTDGGGSWSPLGDGVGSDVNAIAISGTYVYAGGQFSSAGVVSVNRMAKWSTSGSSWSAVPSGSNGTDGTVRCIAINGTDVYIGGSFTAVSDGTVSASHIAKWNGSNWSALGGGMGNDVYAIAISGSNVYAGGNFNTLGDGTTSAQYIAIWNGTTWAELGGGVAGGWDGTCVYALAINGSDVFVGGDFLTAGGTTVNGIAKWSGSTWSAMGEGVNNSVLAIAINGIGDVYAGGYFTQAGGVPASKIAKWNGSAWSALGVGVNNSVYEIAISGIDVYAGGDFLYSGGTYDGDGIYTGGGTSVNHIAKWNGSSWSALGTGVNDGVNAITISGSDLYAGGYFTSAGGASASRIAKWSGSAWSSLDNGVSNGVCAMAICSAEGKLYMGGEFSILNNSIGAFNVGTLQDPSNPLPVELITFTAHPEGASIVLNWKTATEVNNAGFAVQRKAVHGLSFTSETSNLKPETSEWIDLSFVEGSGTTNAPKNYSFTDKSAAGKVSYRLKQIDRDGKFEYSQTVEVTTSTTPKEFALMQNYPNPFNPTTMISYQLPVSNHVSLKVFDLLGKEVATLVNDVKEAGTYSTQFDGAKLSSGIYFARLSSNGKSEMKKLLLMK